MSGRRALRCSLLLAAVVAIAGCKNRSTSAQPATFDRTGDIAFACFDEDMGTMAPLSSCRVDANGNDPEGYTMLALVTQTGRGEIATVDLKHKKVLDLDPGVPGYTFYRVLPVPVAVVVPPNRPSTTYVASFAARRIEAIPSHLLHPDATDTGGSEQTVALPGAPMAMVLADDGSALYVAVPMRDGCGSDAGTGGGCGGQVYRIALDAQGGMGTPEPMLKTEAGDPLPATVPDPSMLPATLPPSSEPAAWQLACTTSPTFTPPSKPPAEVHAANLPMDATATAIQPSALAVDGDGFLLVADRGLPIIHRIDLATGTEASALAVGTPTRGLVVTPPVPVTPDSTTTARYVYAIDDTDQSVLTVDYTSGSPTFGAVLSVKAGSGPNDRLELSADARALAVATPDYSPGETAPVKCDPANGDLANSAGPLQLRGAFLMAGLLDGTLRVVDIEDLDIGCRGYAPTAGGQCTPVRSDDDYVYVRRHAPRISQRLQDVFLVNGSPLFRVDEAPARVLEDGRAESGVAPGLTPLSGGCPEGMTRVYPVGQGDPLVCTLANPWVNRTQRWTATWQGGIPGTSTGRGEIGTGGTIEAPGSKLCDLGVLGSQDVPGAGDPLSAYAGDVLVVTSELPADTADDPACEIFAGSFADRDEVAFPIRHAFQSRVEVATESVSVPSRTPNTTTLDAVRTCFGDHLAFTIRTSGVYTVASSVSEFMHPVEAQSDGSCYVPAGADPRDRGRAFQGQLFENHLVAFQIPFFQGGDESPKPGTSAQVLFDVTNVPAPIALQLGLVSSTRQVPVLPSAVRYNPENQRLYVVDETSRGLLEFDLEPFALRNTFD